MKIDVVIGSGYGDEGKGLSTAYLASIGAGRKCVIRFNGGAQAGHTVVHDKIRHVFSHFGSATLQGVRTYLSEHFVCNPSIFCQELNEAKKGDYVDWFTMKSVYVHPDCLVTIPHDMILNRAIERSRGTNKHGSVGIGFNETINRSQYPNLKLTVQDLWDLPSRELKIKISDISAEYASIRLAELGIELNNEEISAYTSNDMVWDFITYQCSVFVQCIELKTYDELNNFDHLIFEGAQGLMLDQDYGTMPYCTRSNTGLRYVMQIVDQLKNVNVIDAHYVTRAYTTRHGVGPLPFEMAQKPYANIEDKTNVPNPWQDSLRYSYLNLDEIKKAVTYDVQNYADERVKVHGIITCMDQLRPQNEVLYVIQDNKICLTSKYNLWETFKNCIKAETVYFSVGPSINNMVKLEK